MNFRAGKHEAGAGKAKKIIENILCAFGILFLVILLIIYIVLETKHKYKEPEEEEYTGMYPTYISEVREDAIAEESYYDSPKEALKNAEIYYDEYEPYQKNMDSVIARLENEECLFLYYQSNEGEKSSNTFAKFRIKEINGEEKYAFVRSYVRDAAGAYEEYGNAYQNTASQLAKSDYMQEFGIDAPDSRFVFGDIAKESLEEGESVEEFRVEGQKPDGLIEYEENGKIWYFWYFENLQSKKEGRDLSYTLGKET